MSSNIVHQYFKKEAGRTKIMVKVNPILLKGTELTIGHGHSVESRELEFDLDIFDDMKADGFVECSPMEFNLYLSGLAR